MTVSNEYLIEQSMQVIQPMIQEMSNKIDNIAETTINPSLSELAKEIFDSKGTTHGRNWEDNTPATAKRKGKNHRNVETGLLQDTLEQDGFLAEDNYMGNLPQRGIDKDYQFANYGNNKFDDIGRTPDDEKWLEGKIEEALRKGLT